MSLIEGKGRVVVGGDPCEAPKAGAWHQRKASKNKNKMFFLSLAPVCHSCLHITFGLT